jgi:carbonic anhydrase
MEFSSLTPQEALNELRKGNERFASGSAAHPHVDRETLRSTCFSGQHPFACVLGCSDSREPVELIFDQGVGDLFVVRVAGNVLGPSELGSVEYAVEHLGVPVFLVMGHKRCGAVKAVYEHGILSGNLKGLSEKILPAVEKARQAAEASSGERPSDEEIVDEAAKVNVWNAIEEALVNSHAVQTGVRAGSCSVVGAFYCLDTGEIEWMGTHPNQDGILHTQAGS